MLSELVRKALWLLLHCVYTIAEKIVFLCFYVHFKSVELFSSRDIKQSFYYVNSNLRNVSKIPNHVVFILDDENLSHVELSRLVIWSLAAGISYFTFYDYTGSLSKNEEKLFRAVQELKECVPGYIKWKNQKLNGYVNGTEGFSRIDAKITVNILSLEDGKQKIASVFQNFCWEVQKGQINIDNVTVSDVDKCIDHAYSFLPEPNIALYTGAICKTNGLLPWHIRLTEFFSFGSRHFVNEVTFVDLLKKYGHCEQRFGT